MAAGSANRRIFAVSELLLFHAVLLIESGNSTRILLSRPTGSDPDLSGQPYAAVTLLYDAVRLLNPHVASCPGPHLPWPVPTDKMGTEEKTGAIFFPHPSLILTSTPKIISDMDSIESTTSILYS